MFQIQKVFQFRISRLLFVISFVQNLEKIVWTNGAIIVNFVLKPIEPESEHTY